MSCGGKNRSKSLLLSPGLRPCSLMCMLSQVSELPCLTLHIRQVCPQADRKASKQNSCPWQYKMSLQRRLLTVTSDLPGAFPLVYCPPGRDLVVDYQYPRAMPPVTHGSAFQAPECLWLIFLPRIRGRWSYGGKKRSKSLLLSPGLAPLQTDAYAQPCKQASLSDHPHPSGLPIGRRKSHKTK